jgi:hypothetical protein
MTVAIRYGERNPPALAADDVEREAVGSLFTGLHLCPMTIYGWPCMRPVHTEGDHVATGIDGLVCARAPFDCHDKQRAR